MATRDFGNDVPVLGTEAGPGAPKSTTLDEGAIEALAEAWASIDGKLDYFRREKGMKGIPPVEDWRRLDWRGHYVGYIVEAEEMIRRLEARGFTIAPLSIRREA